ncbi:MAG: hypothetical protein QOF77_1886 [Solirubrobacteraceae bacterium]|jgi:hypothetical protein|nr:hypothetical protein [Solirubrobacteraceae bacterium]
MSRRWTAGLAALCLGATGAAVNDATGAADGATRHRRVVCHHLGHGGHRHKVCTTRRHPPKTHEPTITPSSPSPPTTTPAITTTSAPPPPPPTTPTTSAAPPRRTAVEEYEYSVVSGHPIVAAGSVELNISNIGQDDHNLTISQNGVAVAQTPILHPGDPTTTLTAELAPGTYRLYCSLADHDHLGMHATLVVE